MQTLHEYFNLASGIIDLTIAGVVVLAGRRLIGGTPKILWILAAFFAVSGLGYLNEQSPIFGTNTTLAVVLDVARLIALVSVAAITPRLVRAIGDSLRTAQYQSDDRKQAMLDRFHGM